MKKTLLLLSIATLLLFTATFCQAQSTYQLKQVIVLCEGQFGGPVVVGAYNPMSSTYTPFDTINARFATDVILDNGFIYVAADSLLLKYDATTKALLTQRVIYGIRELCVWNQQILVSRGDVGTLSSYFQAYNKSDLSFVYELTNLSGDAAELKVLNDTAYVSVNNFGTMGFLAVVNLNAQTLDREIDLGVDGINPESVRIEGNKVYTVSSPNFVNTSVTKYSVNDGTTDVSLLNTSNGCAASALFNSNVYFQVASENKLRVFNTLNATIWDSLQTGTTAYGLGIDTLNAIIYSGVTDFTSFGKVYMYDFYGTAIGSFDVQVSPSTFAFDVIHTTGIQHKENASYMFPNPSTGHFSIRNFESKIQYVEVFNILGEMVWTNYNIGMPSVDFDFSDLPKGVYTLKISSEKNLQTQKLILQ